MSTAGWRGELNLRYHRRGARTVAFDAHTGPLRVLQPLYPEGEGVCHHVLVHPPGGVVGGDELHVQVDAQAGSHALLTTPGATRFYRSEGALALQHTHLRVAEGARLEWLPMETIAYTGCLASNRVTAQLEPGAEMMGWDVLALGLAAAGQPFETGVFTQQLELPGQWLERGRIAAHDATLLQGPVGWAGHTVSATLWFAAGAALSTARRTALVDAARACLEGHALAGTAGATAPQACVVVLRVLAARVEPLMQLFAAVRAAWRQEAWGLAAEPPRIWRT
jgi:urease accessory protein